MSFKPAVPYAFAKANGVVVTALDNGLAQVAVRNGAHAGALPRPIAHSFGRILATSASLGR